MALPRLITIPVDQIVFTDTIPKLPDGYDEMSVDELHKAGYLLPIVVEEVKGRYRLLEGSTTYLLMIKRGARYVCAILVCHREE